MNTKNCIPLKTETREQGLKFESSSGMKHGADPWKEKIVEVSRRAPPDFMGIITHF